MIISKTPLRISLAGGGTDFRSYYEPNGFGAVLSTSINSYLYVTVKKQTRLFAEKYRLNYSETERVLNIDEIKNSIIRQTLKFLNIDEQLYISTISDVPASTGLGSSSSFTVGLLNALYRFKGHRLVSAVRLAEEASYIEVDMLKRPMGKQDHYAAAFGGLNYIRFNSDETVVIKPIYMKFDNLNAFRHSILIFWTGIKRPSERILKEQNEKNHQNAKILNQMRDQAEYLSHLLTSETLSIKEVGKIMHQGWEFKKTLTDNISSHLIDQSYEKALQSGAYGGKISGAGGGGFLTLIAEPATHGKIAQSLKKYGLIQHQLDFDSEGSAITEIS